MTAMTVTATGTGRTSLVVVVLNNAASIQPGRTAVANAQSGGGVNSLSITPEDTGSLVYGAFMTRNGANPYSVFSAATTFLQDTYGSNFAEVVSLVSTSKTTSGTPVTLGVSSTGGNETFSVIALCEIVASGTLTVDGSTPAPVPGNGLTFSGASQTTASFNPPSSALLVAIAATQAGSVSIGDSQSHAWTQQVSVADSSSLSVVTIWTAPATPPPSLPPYAPPRRRIFLPLLRRSPGTMQPVPPPVANVAGAVIVTDSLVGSVTAGNALAGTTEVTPTRRDRLNVYASGQLVQESALFKNAAGAPADPTSVVLKYKPQGGAVTTLTYGVGTAIVRDGAGAYHFNYDTSGFSGPALQLVTMEWIGTGATQAIGVDYFQVQSDSL